MQKDGELNLKRETAGSLSNKAKKDYHDYNLLELGHAVTDDVIDEMRKCREIHNKIFEEDEYCLVRQPADDCLINNAKRYKYYGWLYLPKPRPDQMVWLYNKPLDQFVKCLWILPSAARMAQLITTKCIVPKEYKRMQAWSLAFDKGTFWEYIRYEHNITMPSEHEYFLANREKLIQAGCKIPTPDDTDPFDFSKIQVNKVEDTTNTIFA